jgi:tetratricopeptide (TPR) repeat protein
MIHTLISMNPEDAEAHSLRCYILGIKGEFDEAMLACDTAILTDQNYAKAYLYRGFLWESHANPEKAQADYSDAVRLGDKTARLTRSSFLLRQGKPREAITDLNEVLRDYPSNWDLYVDRGTAWLNLGESEKALEDFTKAIQLKPNSPKLYSYRAWAYASNKSFPLAIVDYTKVLELSPDNLDALINRGFAYYVMEKHKEAIQDFSQAIKLSPTNRDSTCCEGRLGMD